MKAELAALEGRILGLLSASSGNILDDEELIDTLAQAKVCGCVHTCRQGCSAPQPLLRGVRKPSQGAHVVKAATCG
jgi:hypothetical protein